MKISHIINVAGGDLPSDFSVKIRVEFDYEAAPFDELVRRITSGQSDRVRVQTMLRKMTPARLMELVENGYKVKWNAIGTAVASVEDLLMALSPKQFYDRLTSWGVPNVVQIYANKHNISIEDAGDLFENIINPTE